MHLPVREHRQEASMAEVGKWISTHPMSMVGLIFLGLFLLVFYQEMPELRRYMRIERM